MVKMKKRWLMFVLCLVMLFCSCISVFAEDQIVFDPVGLLTEDQADALEEKAREFEEESGWEVFIVTRDTYDGRSTREYADDFFDERTEETASGIVLLIDMYEREIYISTAGKAIPCLNDSRIEDILDAGFVYVSNGSYASCFSAMLEQTAYYYDKGIPDNQEIYDEDTGKSTYYRKLTPGEIFSSVIVACIPALIIYFSVVAKYRMKVNKYAYNYRKFAKMDLTYHDDQFINQTVTTRRIPRTTTSSSGGGGGSSHRSSSHRSSSGRSHGGGGRKF